QEGLEEESWATIAIEYARGAAEKFLKRHGPTVRTAGLGLEEVILTWLRDDIQPQTAWAPIYGLLGTFLTRSPELTAAEAAVRLGLWLHVQGVRGEWESSLRAPTRLRWGRWLLPTLDHIHVTSDGVQAHLRGTTHGTEFDVRFARQRGDWLSD